MKRQKNSKNKIQSSKESSHLVTPAPFPLLRLESQLFYQYFRLGNKRGDTYKGVELHYWDKTRYKE